MPPKQKAHPDEGGGKEEDAKRNNSTRTYNRRDGELLAAELHERILAHPGNTMKRAQLRRLTKLSLCDLAMSLGAIDERQHTASLARRSEARKVYLWTLLQEPRLRDAVDGYVMWWSEVWARGTMIANCFVAEHGAPASLLRDLTSLKKLLYPERYKGGELPPGLHQWMAAPRLQSFLRVSRPSVGTLGDADQALTYMARRFRGNIQGHVLTHLHSRVFSFFCRTLRQLFAPKPSELQAPLKRALIHGTVDALRPEDAWKVVRCREALGAGPDDVLGRPFTEEGEEAALIAAAEGQEEDERGLADAFETGWRTHATLCRAGVASMLPLATLSRQNAVIDKRIAMMILRGVNAKLPSQERLPLVSSDEVLRRYFLPSRRQLKKRKRERRQRFRGSARRQRFRGSARRQYLRTGCGSLVPKNGELSTVQTDGVSASPTFDVPIRHVARVVFKRSALEGLFAAPGESEEERRPCRPSTSSAPPRPPAQARTSPGPLLGDAGRVLLSSEDVARLRRARRIGVDPGDVNPLTTAELARRDREDSLRASLKVRDDGSVRLELRPVDASHRPVIHNHLSRSYYERRSWRRKHAVWEATRRKANPAYAEAIAVLSQAGTWKTRDPEVLGAMLRAQARGWEALRQELVVSKEHARWKMLMYRKRRMILDQAVRRTLDPKKHEVEDKRTRGVIVGYGNATFRSRGPREQVLKAMIRAMRSLRSEGRPAALVFIDEFRTTKLCHRCHKETRTPSLKTAEGWKKDHRFRDCPHCGSQAAPKRWGRDSGACLNMLMKLDCLLEGREVPEPFRRPGAPAA